MKRAFAIMLLLLPAPAFAQTYTNSRVADPILCVSPAPYVAVLPVATFDVGADGTVHDPALKQSTGNTDVDKAALACVQNAQFMPATKDGTPVAVRRQDIVTWKPDDAMQWPSGDRQCVDRPPEIGWPSVKVRYFIEKDGHARMAPGSPSGNAAADDYVRKCIAGWHLTPGLYKGKTVRVTAEYWVHDPTTVFVQVTTQHEPPKPAISSPAAIGRPHDCTSDYPADALRLGHEGVTGLHFTINVDGSVSDVKLDQSSGFDDLDQAAIECASHFTYKPAMQNGQPVAVPWRSKVRWTDPPAQQETRP